MTRNSAGLSFKRKLIIGTALLTPAMLAGPAFAQTGTDDVEEGDVIVVTGSIREAQQAAIAEKREAKNVVDVASADSVGRFPDENIAAALTRLPGVAVQRDQGQARYIQVRGAPNRWTSVSINGIPQTGTDEGSAGRAYRFDAVPAVLLSELRVNKSLTPNITAEAVTANVDLLTYSALDNEGFTASGDIGYGMMDLGDGEQRQGSLRLGWSDGTWGIVLGGSHYKREQVTDNREYGYSTGTDGNIAPTDIDVRSYLLDRETNGLYGNIEFQPVDGQVFHVRGIYTEFKDDEQRNAYQFELDEASSGTRTSTGGDLVNVPVDGAFNDAKYRNRNLILSTGADLEFDDWGLSAQLGYTRTENSTYLPLTLATTGGANNVSLTYDRSDPNFPVITGLFATDFDVDPITGDLSNPRRGAAIDRFDPTSFNGFNFILPIVTETVSDSMTAKVDLYKQWDDFTVRFGGLFQQRDISGNIFNDAGIVPLAVIGQNVNDYAGSTPWDTGFPLGVSFTYTDNEALDEDQQRLLDQAGIDLGDLNPPQDFFDQKETIFAPYLMGEFELGDLQVIAGARAEYYKVRNSGTASTGGVLTPLSFEDDYFDIFPSVNLRYNVSDDIVLRLAGLRGTARPAYAAVRIGSAINDIGEVIESGNPALKPEYTWGVDASFEWYLPGNGIFSVAAFHRWVDDVLYTGTQRVNSDAFDSDGIDRSNYLLSANFNGQSGTVSGVEFNLQHQFDFLPGALGGFGVQGGLTLLDGEFDALDASGMVVTSDFPGLSDTIVNASVFYEKYGISARVSYQWRSDYIDTVGGLGIGDGEFRGAYENLDVTLRYKINDNFTVYADLANLTDEIYTAFDGTSDFPVEVEQIGARYMFGLRFDF